METSIPDNLTYEQFKALAEHKPSLDGDWIYVLEHKVFTPPYGFPEFGISNEESTFLSLKDAEDYISKLVNSTTGETLDTWCFKIRQKPLGGCRYYKRGAEWLYDRQGKLVDYTTTIWNDNQTLESTFFGRPESRIRFHKGDIVEVEERGMVHLAVIASEGPTVDRFWKLYNRSKARLGYPADASDDCYRVLNGPGEIYHSHVSPTSIMPVSSLTAEMIDYFNRCIEIAEKGETDRNTFTAPSDNLDSGLANISSTSIGIVYDKDAKLHRLVLKEYDYLTDKETTTPLPGNLSAEKLSALKTWLNQVKYGKTRLWYIIRDWNFNYAHVHTQLAIKDVTVDELLSI